ncbi:MAG: translation initiation factor IF-6 [Candidatus Aenigmatarchaeota archaeon]
MKFLRINFDGDPNIGLYGFATDKYCFIGSDRYTAKIKDVLGVKTYAFPLLNMDLVRIFCTGNSSGMIMPKVIEDFDPVAEKIRKNIQTLVINSRYSSVGNLILMNDNGILISPLIKKHLREIEKFFGLPCEITTIANMNLIGNVGFATNKGCLLHPKVKEKEKKLIERVLGVDADITTVNFGSPYPGAGIIANSSGFVVSENCSGPELGRVTDVLGFL